jgi:homocysteine S-methyltransferase
MRSDPSDPIDNPLTPFLTHNGVMILDGALATELERRGADLRDPLWSAKILLENPVLIRQTHYDYFVAGADVATTASYQATFAGFARRGLNRDGVAALMRLSVELAIAARDDFWAVADHRRGRHRPLVAASVGPYGAFLTGGAEYSGNYGLTLEELVEFHRPRMAVLTASGADLLACETVPALLEVEALLALLPEFPSARAWISCTCGDEAHLWHGEKLAAVVELVNHTPQVVAVGVNCTAPHLIAPLLQSVAALAQKPLLAYPNRGEQWDGAAMRWVEGSGVTEFAGLANVWRAAGAQLIGGCCRTTPTDIAAIAATLRPTTARPPHHKAG